ncbi:hypothetical protein GE061_012987 [Apolygus lucorum]|uniref:SEA domain-containing protein n=1 Tax=Apolygus lucorum TaxID=248454 RepID=A0A8S9XV30_APOLU|nr:hypothetical protein GE061_012987 [Apolygus lucorum]
MLYRSSAVILTLFFSVINGNEQDENSAVLVKINPLIAKSKKIIQFRENSRFKRDNDAPDRYSLFLEFPESFFSNAKLKNLYSSLIGEVEAKEKNGTSEKATKLVFKLDPLRFGDEIKSEFQFKKRGTNVTSSPDGLEEVSSSIKRSEAVATERGSPSRMLPHLEVPRSDQPMQNPPMLIWQKLDLRIQTNFTYPNMTNYAAKNSRFILEKGPVVAGKDSIPPCCPPLPCQNVGSEPQENQDCCDPLPSPGCAPAPHPPPPLLPTLPPFPPHSSPQIPPRFHPPPLPPPSHPSPVSSLGGTCQVPLPRYLPAGRGEYPELNRNSSQFAWRKLSMRVRRDLQSVLEGENTVSGTITTPSSEIKKEHPVDKCCPPTFNPPPTNCRCLGPPPCPGPCPGLLPLPCVAVPTLPCADPCPKCCTTTLPSVERGPLEEPPKIIYKLLRDKLNQSGGEAV